MTHIHTLSHWQLSTMDLQHSEFVNVHSVSGIIRDVAFSPRGDGMVLTASMDKTAKLTSMQSNVEVQRSVSRSLISPYHVDYILKTSQTESGASLVLDFIQTLRISKV